ncbi:hypothetical protein JI664_10835 [Rhodobacter sp. NTK016B]|uniref:hypothetical protein n=1 Tax=Rhodobacter sp. NTK016B TaxID=2759676 RepID=UPI001A8FB3FB|nr:hypothetical protein [Rhodobacter sp. NTK016B]MBN8292461.1 hypothetical protein [Rhodobacter sp. NTK016B]
MVVLVADINTSAEPVAPQGNVPQWMGLIGFRRTHETKTSFRNRIRTSPMRSPVQQSCSASCVADTPCAFCKNRDCLFVLFQDTPKGDTKIEGEVDNVRPIQDCHARKQRRERLSVNGLYCKGKFPQQYIFLCAQTPHVFGCVAP